METIIVKSQEFLAQWSIGSRMTIEFRIRVYKNRPTEIEPIWFSDVITQSHYSQNWEQIDASVLKQIEL